MFNWVKTAMLMAAITALFGVMQPVIEHPVLVAPGISVAAMLPAILEADVVISVPAAKVRELLDAIDLLAARTTPTNAVILADHGASAMAAARSWERAASSIKGGQSCLDAPRRNERCTESRRGGRTTHHRAHADTGLALTSAGSADIRRRRLFRPSTESAGTGTRVAWSAPPE